MKQMRKLCALIAACVLLLLPAAQAEETTLPDMERLTQLLDACATAMELTGTESFSAETTQGMQDVALMWVLLDRGLLPDYTAADGKVTLNEEQLRVLHADLFGGGGFVLPTVAPVDGVTVGEGTLTFDVSVQPSSCAGMQIMLCAGDAASPFQQVMLELYRVNKPYGSVTEADLLGADWYGSALAQVLRVEGTPMGWVLTSWGPADDLADSDLGSVAEDDLKDYANEAAGFGVKYPALFAEGTITEDANGMTAVSADGQATFDVHMTSAASTMEDAAALAESAGKTVTRSPEQSAYEAVWDKDGVVYRESVCIAGGKTVTALYAYPADEMEKYAAYAEAIKNSLTMFALSVG